MSLHEEEETCGDIRSLYLDEEVPFDDRRFSTMSLGMMSRPDELKNIDREVLDEKVSFDDKRFSTASLMKSNGEAKNDETKSIVRESFRDEVKSRDGVRVGLQKVAEEAHFAGDQYDEKLSVDEVASQSISGMQRDLSPRTGIQSSRGSETTDSGTRASSPTTRSDSASVTSV